MSVTSLAFPLMAITLILGVVLLLLPNRKVKLVGRLLLAVPIAMALFTAWMLVVLFATMLSSFGNWYVVLTAVITAAIFLVIMFALFGVIRRKKFYLPLLSAVAVCVVAIGGIATYDHYINSLATVGEPKDILWKYDPVSYSSTSSKLAVLALPSTLIFDWENEPPKIDGATALYPIYAAFAHATVPHNLLNSDSADYIQCSKTPEAYNKLIKGEVDVIFVASPSDNQLQAAADAGVEMVLTPIGKEAFVFFVNSQNPVSDMTLAQIQGIYSGELTSWKELGGGNLGKIRAFQRPEDSGSQTALQQLMEGKRLMTPPTEDVVAGMGGIINKVADYRNFSNAFGYSFRFYSTEMVQNNEIKLIAVNGAAPTKENIINGSYPIVSDLYAVTRADASDSAKRLVEWVLSPQGQELIDKTGYVAIK